MTKITKIQVRRDLATNWSTNNPKLDPGEFGFESDTGKLKVGNENKDEWSFVKNKDYRLSVNVGFTDLKSINAKFINGILKIIITKKVPSQESNIEIN